MVIYVKINCFPSYNFINGNFLSFPWSFYLKRFSKEIQTEWNKFTEIFVLSTVPDWLHSGVTVKPGIEPILSP